MDAESPTLEFKSAVSKSFLKTVSAFANYNGGKIIFGISDDGSPIGLDDPGATRLSIENAINDSLVPVPTYTLSENKQDRTVTLEVMPGRAKPYLCSGKAYRRSDTSTVVVDKIEHGRLVLEGSKTTFDALVSQEEGLTFQTLEEHMHARIGVDEVDDDVLRTLGLLDADRLPTNAGALLADTNSFPGIDLVRFGKSSRDMLDRKRLAGISLLAQYTQAAEFFERYYVYEHIEGMTRDIVERIPEDAFREAIANALVHRTWDVQASITVSMYDDRVEIVSPGPLPTGITEEEYLSGHVSVLRNPLLADVFFRLGYIEQFGTGVLRIRELYQESPVKPQFVARQASIAVVLPVTELPDMSPGEAKVWDALAGGASLSRAQLDDATGFSKDKTIRMLNGLLAKGLIERVGAGPGTQWKRA